MAGTKLRGKGRPVTGRALRALATKNGREHIPRSMASRLRSDAPLVLLDVLLIEVAYLATFLLRFDFDVPSRDWAAFRRFLPVAVVAHIALNWRSGLYRQMWRHASIKEGARVAAASLAAGLALLTGRLLGLVHVPVSVTIVGSMMTVMALGTLRFQARLVSFRQANHASGVRVVIVGAGDAAAAIIRDMQRPSIGMRPVAIVDDDTRFHGRSLQGVPVIGPIDLLPEVLRRQAATLVLLAIARADRTMIRRVAELADAAGAALKVLPRVEEVVDGKVTIRDVRDVGIEDLLGRQQVETDLDAVGALLRGRRVLITGAGGSIGAEIVRQVAAFEPEQLLMLDNDETHLHDAAHSLSMTPVQLLVDIRDRQRVSHVFRKWQPQVVFHAAALKHVPVLEANPTEAVRTNVVGTANVVDASADVCVERFVFISTDKAVQPTSVMGASKRIGEHLVLNQTNGHRYSAVRFGNVLGSRGSVVPTFARQISSGQAVTVTDPRMTRFFMSTPEAVQLVLQAAAIAEGGDVLMLDMGEAVNIHDLAEKMIRLSGRQPGTDVEIRFTGMRPGEKLHEELRSPEEAPQPTSHLSIVRVLPAPMSRRSLAALVGRLVECANDGRESDAALMLLNAAHGGEARRSRCQKTQQSLLGEPRSTPVPTPPIDAAGAGAAALAARER